jgi:hypothetical protein
MKKVLLYLFLVSLTAVVWSGADRKENIIERDYFFYIAENDQFVEPIEEALIPAREILIDILRDSLSYKPRIYVENDLNGFRDIIGTAFPDWGAAAALPYREMIAIKSPAHFRLGKSLRELVQHEYAHLALHDRLRMQNPPRWLDEGVAMYVSAEWGWDDNFAMSRAVVFRTLVPLREIEKINLFPGGRAQTAYAQSYLAVKYLLDEYGVESLNYFMDEIQYRETFDEAFLATTGSDYDDFEKEFFDFLNERYNLMTLFGDLYFLWIFLAAVVVIGFLLKLKKRKKYYKKWEEEERLQSTDFDYGDPDNPEQVDDEDKPWA